jgi:hypothetical protein
MRFGTWTRAGVAVLALLLGFSSMRHASPRNCVDDDCDMPCCDRDDTKATFVPVLPCCRTIALDQATAQPLPTTFEPDGSPFLPLSLDPAPSAVVAIALARSTPARTHLPAPPLYKRHCALLL